MTAMQLDARDTSEVASEVGTQRLLDERLMLLVPVLEFLGLVLIPNIPDTVAAAMLIRFSIGLMIMLGLIDLLSLRVPNLIVYPSVLFVIVGTSLLSTSLLIEALIGGAALLTAMLALALIGRGSMGMGDVKFACLAGCVLGWRVGLISLATGFAFGGVGAVLLLVFRVKRRKEAIALVPFLAAGAVTWTLLGGALVHPLQ
jgi:leader peptidase (prepilin peptidase)/N-methyltransferase